MEMMMPATSFGSYLILGGIGGGGVKGFLGRR